ncbi:hypothetical protein XTPLMG730_1937 [Xanthomonas translucens pv. phlei]|uniref:Uncharacterized protein n=1 Tax=Xanthomonas graminis pv. phlei TaxID=487906 RepID=A0A0K2ZUP4_9XANT|nr:hypothetical protein XTPLMG730_1937 [Xanthomonas translucens pv. phlei]
MRRRLQRRRRRQRKSSKPSTGGGTGRRCRRAACAPSTKVGTTPAPRSDYARAGASPWEGPHGLRDAVPALDRAAGGVLGGAGQGDPLAAPAAEDPGIRRSAVPALVRRRPDQPVLQRGRSAFARARRAAGAGGGVQRNRADPRVHLCAAACRGRRLRRGAAAPGRAARRPRGHLHAEHGRGGVRDAGLRAHRRGAFGGVRRLRRAQPGVAHRRCGAEAADRRRCRQPRRQDHPVQAAARCRLRGSQRAAAERC